MQELHRQEMDEYVRERKSLIPIHCDFKTVKIGNFDIRERNIPFCFKHTRKKNCVCEQCGFADNCYEVKE